MYLFNCFFFIDALALRARFKSVSSSIFRNVSNLNEWWKRLSQKIYERFIRGIKFYFIKQNRFSSLLIAFGKCKRSWTLKRVYECAVCSAHSMWPSHNELFKTLLLLLRSSATWAHCTRKIIRKRIEKKRNSAN